MGDTNTYVSCVCMCMYTHTPKTKKKYFSLPQLSQYLGLGTL